MPQSWALCSAESQTEALCFFAKSGAPMLKLLELWTLRRRACLGRSRGQRSSGVALIQSERVLQ
jgi:hypothetical protein